MRGIPNGQFYFHEERILRHIIPRCSNAGGVVIAHEHFPEDTFVDTVERDILGWICAEALEEGLLVHYVYVRGHQQRGKHHGSHFRRRGIATELLQNVQHRLGCEGQPVFYSYKTSVCWETPEARDTLRELGATYVMYLKFRFLPQGWADGRGPRV